MDQHLIALRGVSGSGKTTEARALHLAIPGSRIHAADDYQVDAQGNYAFDPKRLSECHQKCRDAVRRDLRSGFTVIVHNTMTTEKEVEEYHAIAREMGVRFVSMVVENRHGSTNVHGVPEDKLQQQLERFTLMLRPGVVSKVRTDRSNTLDLPATLDELISNLDDVPQGYKWHPEGDVGTHTAIVLGRVDPTPELMWAAVFHDTGKMFTTTVVPRHRQGKFQVGIHAYGHEQVSVRILDHYIDRIPEGVDRARVRFLVAEHMKAHNLSREEMDTKYPGTPAGWLDDLAHFAQCDDMMEFQQNPAREVFTRGLDRFEQLGIDTYLIED